MLLLCLDCPLKYICHILHNLDFDILVSETLLVLQNTLALVHIFVLVL